MLYSKAYFDKKFAEVVDASSTYGWARARMLEGTFPANVGVFGASVMRVHRGWGVTVKPFSYGNAAIPMEPPWLDAVARSSRTWAYRFLRDAGDCARCSACTPVVVGVKIGPWWKDVVGGDIPWPLNESQVIDSAHAVQILNYDHDQKRFKFRHYWGKEWGDKGCGTIPFEYLNEHFSDGWVITSIEANIQKKWPIDREGLCWRAKDLTGNFFYGVDAFIAGVREDRPGWFIAYRNGDVLEVVDLFVKPAFREIGLGAFLVRNALQLARRLELLLRIWVHHPDIGGANMVKVDALAKKFGLFLMPSPVKGASYLVTTVDRDLPSNC
jgi:GNAT superfamily N-acetyltransferase